MDYPTRERINNFTNMKLIKMPPKQAWAILEEITEFDSTYDPQKTRRGLYVVSDEVDKYVHAQF